MNDFFNMPENVATFGGRIDSLFVAIMWITAITFVVVEIALVVVAIKYRYKPERKAHFTHGNRNLEIAWTAGTALIVFTLAVVSRPLWLDIKDPSRFPQADLELAVHAKQFEWNVTYPGADGRLGTSDDYMRRSQMHIPVNRKVHLTLTAEDVIHSFYLPNFRLKQDAVPGMQIKAWLEATKEGQYVLGCAELCGLGHYRMKGTVTVHNDASFQQWNQQQIAAAASSGSVAAAAP